METDDTTNYTRTLGFNDFQITSGWQERNGEIFYSGDSLTSLRLNERLDQRQATFTFDVKLEKGASAGLSFRAQEQDSEGRTAFIIDASESRAYVTMREYTENVSYGVNVSADIKKTHRIKIVLNGSYGEFYLDGKLLFTRCDIAYGSDYLALLGSGSVSFSNFSLTNEPVAPESWDKLLESADLTREGRERFESRKFEYYQAGIGKTNLYVGTDGFTSPESYAKRPGDIPDYFFDPMLVYDYWWDGTTRIAPFAMSGGYLSGGTVYAGATGNNWKQTLDISSGTVITKLETEVNGKLIASTRSVFVTEDGTVCYRITSDSDLPFVFNVSGRKEGYKVYQYEYDKIREGSYDVSCAVSDDMLLVSSHLATDNAHKAYLAVKAVCPDGSVSYDAEKGNVTVNPVKSGTFYLFISPASDLSPEGNDSEARVKNAADKSYEGNLKETSDWWADFWNKGRISVYDKGLAIWYIRSQYYQAAALASARVPAGCFSTNIDGFFGNICFEYDMMFSATSLQRTNHLDITGDIENWIRRYYEHSCDIARNGEIFGNVPGASVLCGLMGYDCTPCESWSLRENWHATHGGMNLTSFLFRNASYGDGDYSFAKKVLESQIRMMETAFYYDNGAEGYKHKGIWSPSENDFFHMVSGDPLQSESAYWALKKALETGIDAYDPDSVYRTGFSGPNQASPSLLSYYWQPARELDTSFLKLLDSVLGGSSFDYNFNRAWAAALCARAGWGEIAEKTVLSMLDTSSVLYDDTYMCESLYNQSDYKRAPELGAHGSLVDALSLMLMDGEDEGVIRVFGAVPEEYVEYGASFDRFAAPGNLEVSASVSKEKTTVSVQNRGSENVTRTLLIRVPSGSTGVSDGEFAEGCFAKKVITVNAGETVTVTVSGNVSSGVSPTAVSPLFPDEGQLGVNKNSVSFCWTPSSNSSEYVLVISENADMSKPVLEIPVTAGNYIRDVKLPSKKYRTVYYWCVYSTDSSGTVRTPMDGGARHFTTDGEAPFNEVCGIEFETAGAVELSETAITLEIPSNSPYCANIAYFELKQQDNFTVSFRLSDYYPTADHQQIGLYIAETDDITQNADNWGKFMRVYSSGHSFEYYGTEDSWSGGGKANDSYKGDSVYMKLEASQGKFMFYVSEDGNKWKKLGSCARKFTDDIMIGFSGATFSEAEASAKIEEVKIIYE